MKSILFLSAISVCLGIGIAGFFHSAMTMPLFFTAFFLTAFLSIIRRKVAPLALFLAFFLSFNLFSEALAKYDKTAALFKGKYATVEGMVEQSSISSGGYFTAILKTRTVKADDKTFSSPVRVLVYSKKHHTLKYGDIVSVRLKFFDDSENTDTSYKYYLMSQKIHLTAFAYNIAPLNENSAPLFTRLFERIHTYIFTVFQKYLPGDSAGFVSGILSGKTETISEELTEKFAVCSLSHIVAVSGFNLSIIYVAVAYLFRKIRFQGIIPKVISLLLIWLFTLFVGASFSVVRAAIMITVYIFADTLRRQNDIFASLGASAIIILLINPAALFDIGFQLSFMATLSIVLFTPVIFAFCCRWMPKGAADAVSVTLAAQVLVFPLLAYHFGRVPGFGIISNFFIVPCIPFMMAAAFLLLLLSPFEMLAFIPAVALDISCDAVFGVIDFFVQLPLAFFAINNFSFVALAFYYIFCIALSLMSPASRYKF